MADIVTKALAALAAASASGGAAASASGGAAASTRSKALIMLYDSITIDAFKRAFAVRGTDVLVTTPLKGFIAWREPSDAEVTQADVQAYLRYVANTYHIVVASVVYCDFVRALRNTGYSRPILAVKEDTSIVAKAKAIAAAGVRASNFVPEAVAAAEAAAKTAVVKEGNDIVHAIGFTDLVEELTPDNALNAVTRVFDSAVAGDKALVVLDQPLTFAPFQRAFTRLGIEYEKGFNAWHAVMGREDVTPKAVNAAMVYCATLCGPKPVLADAMQDYLRYIANTYSVMVVSVSQCIFVRALRNAGYSRPILAVKEASASTAAAVKEGNDIVCAIGFTDLMEKMTPATALENIRKAFGEPAGGAGAV